MTPILQSLIGYGTFLLTAWVMSSGRRQIQWRYVVTGLGIQLGFAILVIYMPAVQEVLKAMGQGVLAFKDATEAAARFMFGYLAGGDLPFIALPGANTFIFAFQPLPMVMVFSAVVMLLFHWGVLPAIMRVLSGVFRSVFGLGSALGVATAGKMFVGQIETALLIKPYIAKLSKSELLTLLTLGMATTSGTVVALYASILDPVLPNAVGHVLATFLLSIPAALVISQIMIPPQKDTTAGDLCVPYKFENSLDALAQGTTDGLKIVVSIAAFMLVTLALVNVADKVLAAVPLGAYGGMSLQKIFSYVCAPLTWLMGIPWSEAAVAGEIVGTKTVLNEIIAYMNLAKIPLGTLSEKTILILTYALGGFANLTSIGLVVGGVGSLAPERRQEIIQLSVKALIAGSLSSFLSATVIGLVHQILGS
jgi:CNT family concentrative nucleoside transporter